MVVVGAVVDGCLPVDGLHPLDGAQRLSTVVEAVETHVQEPAGVAQIGV